MASNALDINLVVFKKFVS